MDPLPPLTDLVQSLQQALSGRPAGLDGRIVLPFHLELDGVPRALHSTGDLWRAIDAARRRVPMAEAALRVTAFELPRLGRFRVWLAVGGGAAGGRMVLSCRMTDGQPVLDRLEWQTGRAWPRLVAVRRPA